jgi:hypothetical protein
MSNSPFLVIINGYEVHCDTAESVIALLNASKSPAAVHVRTARHAAAPTAAPVRRRRVAGRATARTIATPPKSSSKNKGLSKRSVTLLQEFSRSGGSVITADRLARATGAKGPKGVGGSLTALRKELSNMGHSIDSLISRKKTPDGTVWMTLAGAEQAIADIVGSNPSA